MVYFYDCVIFCWFVWCSNRLNIIINGLVKMHLRKKGKTNPTMVSIFYFLYFFTLMLSLYSSAGRDCPLPCRSLIHQLAMYSLPFFFRCYTENSVVHVIVVIVLFNNELCRCSLSLFAYLMPSEMKHPLWGKNEGKKEKKKKKTSPFFFFFFFFLKNNTDIVVGVIVSKSQKRVGQFRVLIIGKRLLFFVLPISRTHCVGFSGQGCWDYCLFLFLVSRIKYLFY